VTAPGALSGVRVIDMTSVVMGPYATQIMGDMGADVIKVEPPAGDTTRKISPMRNPNMGYMFLNLNRNKRSLVLNLKLKPAVDALLSVVRTADVLVSNVRPNALARLGLDLGALGAANSRLVSVSLVGFAQEGPYRAMPVYEDLIQGLTTIPSLLVETGSEQPHYVPYAFNDRTVGLHAAVTVLAALLWRERTGKGQHIEIPMFETMAQGILGEHLGGETFAPPLGPMGYRRSLSKNRRPYRTKDGFICVIIYTDRQWQAFFDLQDDGRRIAEDERFRDIGARTQHIDELYQLIAEAMATRTTTEWLESLQRADIPATPLHTLESLLSDPHLEAVGLLQTVEHPTEGTVRQPGHPARWSESPPATTRHAPRLGEHSVEILQEAGVSADHIAHLLQTGATVQPQLQEQP